MSTPLLKVNNLSVDFQTEDELVHAIQNISFELNESKTLALVGESGSGKSVSALSIIGLLPSPPAKIISGTIEFCVNQKTSIDLLKCLPTTFETLRGNEIGIIFQEPMTSLNPLMKCGDQVAETILLHQKCSKDEADLKTLKLFEEVKLPTPKDMMNRYPHELSGGQKQRVMIAISICCNPSLLIADEPTTALDVTVQRTILELLKDLQNKRKMAILFITHDLNLVKGFADDVMIMRKSQCIEYGSTNEVFNHPKEAYTKGLLSCRPSHTERVRVLKMVQEASDDNFDLPDIQNIIDATTYQKRIEEISSRKPMIELKNLSTWYPTQRNFLGKPVSWYKAVNGVDLTIKEGETLGLVGESGCGKTTIGKTIVQLNKITSGEIFYKGKSIVDFTKSELAEYKKEVQIIFQDPYSSLNPRVQIGDAIVEPMVVHDLYSASLRKEKAIELLEKVGLLPSHFNRYPHEFSGGQRQRICIARALALQPSFIVCDESVSALDISVQAQVLNLLVSLRDEFNLTYLFISHDLGVIKHMSGHIAVMQNGKIVEYGHSELIYKNPNSNYTKTLIESSY